MQSGTAADRASVNFPSIWAFILADCFSFAILFTIVMTERIGQSDLFDKAARHLDAQLGLVNTLILITGSWLVALAVVAARRGDGAGARKWLLAAIAVSSAFGAIKLYEYSAKIGAGFTPITNDFFTYYYMLTGLHFLHYIGGMAALIALVFNLDFSKVSETSVLRWIVSVGIFWHMVDLLWLFIYPMLYLLPLI